MNILELSNIVKRYHNHLAVDDVSFVVPKGSVFGMLGPNGAGKTSLIRMITTITQPDAGELLFLGKKLDASSPSLIGYMPEERGMYKKMKVGEHLLYLAQLKGLQKRDAQRAIAHWIEKFDIKDWWNKKIEELSKGMQQKVQFIATVIHQPPLLILDEPFSGLDPINANLLKDEIKALSEQGTTIIFSTHRMEQVEEICEHIVLINKGKNILQDTVQGAKEQFKENIYEIGYRGALPQHLPAYISVTANNGTALSFKANNQREANQLLQDLLQQGVAIQSFQEILPTLNEVFIKKVQTI